MLILLVILIVLKNYSHQNKQIMNTYKFILKSLRRVVSYTPLVYKHTPLSCEKDVNASSALISSLLSSGEPCMIARFGSTELSCVVNYLGIKKRSVVNFILQKQGSLWWEKLNIENMRSCSGFFPSTEESLAQFSELMLNDMQYIDILGCWREEEEDVHEFMSPTLKKIHLQHLEPWWSNDPWSSRLEGKRVLVIHPFASTIMEQYKKHRHDLFENPRVLPSFDLDIIQAVQSLGGNGGQFKSWFDALDWMKEEMDKRNYDVALIGCGAYGFSLAAHAKRTGHQAIHMGGALQLLFGIKGKRWEDPMYGVQQWGLEKDSYNKIFNNNWVYPSENERPADSKSVEGGCYWG